MKRLSKVFAVMFTMILLLNISIFSVFAADTSIDRAIGVNTFTGFRAQTVKMIPLVVQEGSTYEMKANSYAITTNYSRDSHYNYAYWRSNEAAGFNKYCRDNNYQVVGWDISVTGTFLAKNQGSVVPADQLRTMEYTLGNNELKRMDVSYLTNISNTFSWKVYLPDVITDNNTVNTALISDIIYWPGGQSGSRKVRDEVKITIDYWPGYGL